MGSEVVRYSMECIIPLCNKLFQQGQSRHDDYAMCLRNLFKVIFKIKSFYKVATICFRFFVFI